MVHVFKLLPSPAQVVAPEPKRTVVRPRPAPSPPPVPVVPKRKPPEPKVVKPKPKPPPPPVIPKPNKVVPRPAVKKPEPVLEKTTLREWQKKNPPTKPKPKQITRPRKVKVTPLNIDKFKVEISLPKIPPRPGLNHDEIKLQDLYLAGAAQIIENQWLHLKAGANLRGPANATMQFRIGGDGGLWALRLVEISAIPKFNDLVQLTFRKVGNLGRPPSAINYPLTMTFKLN